jgi:hypothetical protein
MRNPYVYDKAKYHYDGSYPEGLPVKQAFNHTGMFLGWNVDQNLCSDWFKEELKPELAQYRDRKITGAQLYEFCDGVFEDGMLNEEGNAFARAYFDFEKGEYLFDYEDVLGEDLPTMYHVEDNWENYEKLKCKVDERYEAWKKRGI